jgi:hypothetical protein
MPTGPDARRRYWLLAVLLAVLVPVTGVVGLDDGWLAGPLEISDDDAAAWSGPDAALAASAALVASTSGRASVPPATDDDGLTSRPGVPATDRAPPRAAPSLA